MNHPSMTVKKNVNRVGFDKIKEELIMNMSENEKKILSVLYRFGPLTKKELSLKGQMGWATVVKMVTRLEEKGYITLIGTRDQPNVSGKGPSVYDLADSNPLAIGIDVSYSSTNIVLTNLKNSIIFHKNIPNPPFKKKDDLVEFLSYAYQSFCEESKVERSVLRGVGVVIPLWLIKHEHDIYTSFIEILKTQYQIDVRIQNHARSYAIYKKWVRNIDLKDFIYVSIRKGIGVGLLYQGELISGYHRMSGEIGHVKIDTEDGKLCRCGKIGCLETLINQDVLYQEAMTRLHHVQKIPKTINEEHLLRTLDELFTRAKQGHQEAIKIVKQAAAYLGIGLAQLLLAVDIPHVIISANFGNNGDCLIPFIEEEVKQRIIPGIEFTLSYSPLEPLGYAQGGALLILKDYFASTFGL